MIFELESQNSISGIPDIFSLLPSREIGLFLWIFCSIIVLVYSLYKSQKTDENKKIDKYLSLLLPTIIYIGTFINSYGIMDEVSINLEHPYNLYHFGKFSMSSEKMIGGTVELIYYLLHTPFAQTQTILVFGNFLISLIVGYLHLFILWKFPISPDHLNNLILLSCFSVSFPLVTIFSSGFGNSLLSLLVLISIYLYLQGKVISSLIISGLLPIIRPDGIILSVANILTILIVSYVQGARILKSDKLNTKTWLTWLLFQPFISLFIYLLSYKIAYGYWIPTPILFKSLKISMLALTDWNYFYNSILSWFSIPVNSICLCFAILFLSFLFIHRRGIKINLGNEAIFIIFIYTLTTSFTFLFYNFTKGTIADFSGGTYARYWICFQLTLIILFLTILAKSLFVFKVHLNSYSLRLFLSLFCFILILITSGSASNQFSGTPFLEPSTYTNRRDGVFAGYVTQKILPDNFSISTSEMNTFGLMINRPVIDLWGYTNRDIAVSKICNAIKMKNNDKFFLKNKPDIYWPYWFTKFPERNNYDTVELYLGSFWHTGKAHNLLGDMNQVFKMYDVFILIVNNHQIAYLVRKELSDILITHLNTQQFKLVRNREINWEYFRQIYNSQKFIQYNCS